MKLKVKKEGRNGIYLIDKKDAIDFVASLKQETIHNFIQGSVMQIGADWNKKNVIDFIKNETTRIAIVTAPNLTMRHHLVAISKNDKRYAFDIGEITEKQLQIL